MALQVARDLADRVDALTADIQRGLFEHYIPYREAADAGASGDGSCPHIARAEDVWPYVKPAHVLVEPMQGRWTIEIAFATAWDVEHTVAAIFQDQRFVELNGSVRGQ